MALILEAQLRLDLPEDSDPIVGDPHRRRGSRCFHRHGYLCSAGMVDGVVHHLRETVLPDPEHVITHPGQERSDFLPPEPVFFELIQRRREDLRVQRHELIGPLARSPLRGDQPFLAQRLHVATHSLSCDPEAFASLRNHIVRMDRDRVQQELPDLRPSPGRLHGGNSLLLWGQTVNLSVLYCQLNGAALSSRSSGKQSCPFVPGQLYFNKWLFIKEKHHLMRDQTKVSGYIIHDKPDL